jgi:hypothetical protein
MKLFQVDLLCCLQQHECCLHVHKHPPGCSYNSPSILYFNSIEIRFSSSMPSPNQRLL